MSTQPEALRLAVWIEANVFGKGTATKNDLAVAAELRRLHEVNAELLKALELFLAHSSEPECAIWRYVHEVAHAAIAKSEERAATPQNDALADMGRAAL